jgi:ketosteroid isomerase-like protein
MAKAQKTETKIPTGNIEQQIRTVIQERHEAFARNDRAEYVRYLDPNCLIVSPGAIDTVSDQLSAMDPASGEKRRIDFDHLRIQDFGSSVIAIYHQVIHHQFGAQSMSVPMQVVDSYRKKQGHWLLTSHAEVNDVTQRKPVKMDPSGYDAYVGVYEWAPSIMDIVTRDGPRLLTMVTGEKKPSELLPAGENTFFIPGDADDGIILFVKDASGNVTHYVYTAHGQEIVAKKMK